MNYCNCARNHVFDPLDVRLRVREQKPFHSTSKTSLETCHPPSHWPLPSQKYAQHKIAWPHTARGGLWLCTLPLCREVKAGNDRPQGGRPEPAFRQWKASNPWQPCSPQNTDELINE